MESKGQNDGSMFKWTSQKGLLTIGSFFALAFVSEYFIVSFFAGLGLTQVSANQLYASTLFHILPLAVIAVLVLSWLYLTKYVAIRPRVKAPSKASKSQVRRARGRKKRKTLTQNTFGTVKKVFTKITATLSSEGSTKQHQLSFSRTALESTLTVLTIFLLSAILVSVLIYPKLFTDFATALYSTTSPLQGVMEGLGNALVPIASSLDSIAPAFGNIFGGFVSNSAQSLTQSDIVLRYVLCQNVAAWISAISAVVYVRHITKS
ncbi:MAG: hypothetical protein NWF06_07525 [Candidatus Bathyarchaeota archaeon]|nr:hypothetical protein [Candidatus Bathyarchaeum sp.]